MAPARFVDPFNVTLGDQRPSVLFGDVQVRNALRGGNMRSALDQAPEADLALDPRQIPVEVPDYDPWRCFEVLAPVDGVSLPAPHMVGSVLFLPADRGTRHVATFDLVDDWKRCSPARGRSRT